MKKRLVLFLVMLVFLVLITGFVLADLCKGDDGYFHDCNKIRVAQDDHYNYNQDYEYQKDRYNDCIKDCKFRYRSSCYRRDRCELREQCYDKCKETNANIQKIKIIQNIQDKKDFYRESYEYVFQTLDELKSFYRHNRDEVIISNKREYEYERKPRYLDRDVVYVYLPYRYDYQRDRYYRENYDNWYYDVFYLGRNYPYYSNYKYREPIYLKSRRDDYRDNSYWRYKEPYDPYKYQESDYDYYYKPRFSNQKGTFNWRW